MYTSKYHLFWRPSRRDILSSLKIHISKYINSALASGYGRGMPRVITASSFFSFGIAKMFKAPYDEQN